MSQEERKIVIKLTPRVGQQRDSSSARRLRGEAAEEFNIISQERETLANGRETLLRDYYDHLERTVLQIAKAREFLGCARDLA